MGARLKRLNIGLTRTWSAVRELSGDDAYERYCVHQASHHASQPVLSRKELSQQQQEQKWAGIQRCC